MVLGAAGEDVVVEALLPVDVVDAGLDLGQLLHQVCVMWRSPLAAALPFTGCNYRLL